MRLEIDFKIGGKMPRTKQEPVLLSSLEGQAMRTVIMMVLRDGGYVNMQMTRVVPRENSIHPEPKGNLSPLLRSMYSLEHLCQYKPQRKGMSGVVYGMRGIVPEVCKPMSEYEDTIRALRHQLDRLSAPRWIAYSRRRPHTGVELHAYCPALDTAGFYPVVNGRFIGRDGSLGTGVTGGLIRVALPVHHVQTGRATHTATYEYVFTHWQRAVAPPNLGKV